MRRREFLGVLGGAAVWPLDAHAQQPMKRVGMYMNLGEADAEAPGYVKAFEQGLVDAGWHVGRDVQIDYRWTKGESERIRRTAADLIALAPDVILAVGGSQVGSLQQLTNTVPIVFVQVVDPIGSSFVDSLARPGRNATGFTLGEYGIAGKWIELLKQIAPAVTRVAVLRDPTNPAGIGLFDAAKTAALTLGVEVSPVSLGGAGEIERGLTAFARGINGGMIVTPSSLSLNYRELIIAQAQRHRLPAVYPFRYFATQGWLICYGPDPVDQFLQAARYVDRILRGEKPADLPVQAPTKYNLAINLKAAKVLGLTVPPPLLARADEVIE